ncbi:MAG: hypothetical protein HKL90_13990 [Elusimicrobia bacterium]|nr:hypothetical protein [Elusimicrobiota bacterium]
MSNLNVRFDVNFSARFIRAALTGAMLLASASELASESVSLTTYYPAPSGVYTQLIGTSNTYMARDAGYLAIGTTVNSGSKVTIDPANGPAPATALAVVNAGAPQFALNVLPGGGWSMYDGVGGSYVGRIFDVGGNIGIGVMSPASALSVSGGVQLGVDTSACTAAKEGTLMWTSGMLEVCTGGTWEPAAWSRGMVGGSCTCDVWSTTAGCLGASWPLLSCTPFYLSSINKFLIDTTCDYPFAALPTYVDPAPASAGFIEYSPTGLCYHM